MKLDEYVRALAAGLAALPPDRVALPEASGVSLTPRQPGTISLAGKIAGRELGFAQWLSRVPAPRDTRTWSVEAVHSPRFAFSPADVLALFDAQKPCEAVWRRVFDLVRESAEMNNEPTVTREGLRETLLNAGDGWWGLMADQLLQEAQIECELEGSEMVIPDALQSLFEVMEPLFLEEDPYDFPDIEDPVERRRAQLRSRISAGGLSPVLNAEPWTCYVWEAAALTFETVSETSARATFTGALVEIEAFARLHESPFDEAFRLALFSLEQTGPWDAGFQDEVRTRLTDAGFSQTALEVFDSNAGPVGQLAGLGWPHDRLGAVLALGVADVFGGMGSWNDQDFGESYEEYGRVSGALAQSLGTLWQALLAPWDRGLS